MLNKSEEKLPDKEHLRRALVENPTAAPFEGEISPASVIDVQPKKKIKDWYLTLNLH